MVAPAAAESGWYHGVIEDFVPGWGGVFLLVLKEVTAMAGDDVGVVRHVCFSYLNGRRAAISFKF